MSAAMSTCCQTTLNGKLGPSPFSRVVAFGFYDGILSGISECGACQREFLFDNLYENLDGPVRFFSLAPLTSGSVDRVIKAVGQYQSPIWPIWVPMWTFPTSEIKESLDLMCREICRSAG